RFFTGEVYEVENKVGVLCGLTRFGPAAGTMAAALVFIPGIGNTRTTLTIAAVNVAIGLFAVWMAEGQQTSTESDTLTRRPPDLASLDGWERQVNPTSGRLVLLTLAVSGFVAMMYEVSWTRALSAIIGSSTYA